MRAVLLLTRINPDDGTTLQVYVPRQHDENGSWSGLRSLWVHSARPRFDLIGLAWDLWGIDLQGETLTESGWLHGTLVFKTQLVHPFDPPWKGWINLRAALVNDQFDIETRLSVQKLLRGVGVV